MYVDLDDPEIVSIMLDAKENSWSRLRTQKELESLEKFDEESIEEILEWYRGYYI